MTRALKIFLPLVFLLAVPAAAEVLPDSRTVTVLGQGRIDVPPDLAILTIHVETEAETATLAAGRNAEQTDRVIGRLRAGTGEEDEISTPSYSLNPRYGVSPSGKDQVVKSYLARNTIRVGTRGLDGVGALIDSAVEAGATRVQGPLFSLSEVARHQHQALAAAAVDARVQAEAIARALKVELGRVLSAETIEATRAIVGPGAAGGVGAAVATPVVAGDLTVTARLRVTFALE